MKEVLKNILIFVGVCILTYFCAIYFGNFYAHFFPQGQAEGSMFSIPKSAESFLIGLPLAYLFFLSLLFTAFGGGKKYWWLGIGLLPAALFEIYFDFSHIYFPVALALVGWVIGWTISKMMPKSRPPVSA